jgi:hypothetical protein
MILNSGFSISFYFTNLHYSVLFLSPPVLYLYMCVYVRAFSIVHTSDTHTYIFLYVLWSFIVFSLWLVRLPPQLSKRSVIDIPKNYVHQWTEHDKPSRRWSQKKIESRMKKNQITNLHVNKTEKRTNIYTYIILLN